MKTANIALSFEYDPKLTADPMKWDWSKMTKRETEVAAIDEVLISPFVGKLETLHTLIHVEREAAEKAMNPGEDQVDENDYITAVNAADDAYALAKTITESAMSDIKVMLVQPVKLFFVTGRADDDSLDVLIEAVDEQQALSLWLETWGEGVTEDNMIALYEVKPRGRAGAMAWSSKDLPAVITGKAFKG